MKFDKPDFDRPWKLALEEHFAIPETLGDSQAYGGDFWRELGANLQDLQNQRIEQMDKTGIELSILSLNSPAIQAIHDKKKAVEVARIANNHVAENMARHADRFRSFAALPMQDPDAASKELIRCVKDLGFVGALINGYSQIGEEDTAFYLDLPQYRPFWTEVEKLDVPVYLHPREPLNSQRKPYEGHPWLLGAAWAFGVETATHALRLMCSGLFDEHPKLQIILGHLGEMLPFSVWRAEHRMRIDPRGLPAKKKISVYFYNNFWVTTSGNFRTQALINCILEMGSDRILYSTDYPFESMVECEEWFGCVDISLKDQVKIGRLNTQKLFKLESALSKATIAT
jgi:predicted TIM-barrel fold metal-dependent hydrolase